MSTIDHTEDREDTSAVEHARADRHTTFYYEHVVFLVQGTLFKVPREMLTRESDAIGAMFGLPVSCDSPTEGSSDEHPIRLDGVDKSDFISLLTLLFQHPSQRDTMTTDQWIAVLRMATMWDMDATRTLAITALTDRPLNPVDKIIYSRDLNVSQWERPAMMELIERPEYLTALEAERLGWRMAMAFAEAHERYAVERSRVDIERQYGYGYNRQPGLPNVVSLVDEVLSLDTGLEQPHIHRGWD